jgi:peptidoglycan/LPS O-acetylase OafA/YrhL
MPEAGLEPARSFEPWLLRPLRLPFRHPGRRRPILSPSTMADIVVKSVNERLAHRQQAIKSSMSIPQPEPGNTATTSSDDHKNNNFGILRLILAILVLFSHCYPLSGNQHEPLATSLSNRLTIGGAAVDGFFMISGYLIAISWIRSKSAGDFIVKRALRIYPGYLAACLFSVFIGLLDTAPQSWLYLKSLIYHNDSFLRSLLLFDFGGLDSDLSFKTNPVSRLVNGSLWTLKFEVQCYLMVVFLGLFGVFKNLKLIITFFLAILIIYVGNSTILEPSWQYLCRFVLFFLIGILMIFVNKKFLCEKPIFLLIALIGIIVAAPFKLIFFIVYPFCFAYMIFNLALSVPAFSKKLLNRIAQETSRTDLSYGIYLYAFPIQQILVRFLHIKSPMLLFVIALPLVSLLAFLSWRFVEAPMIRFKNRIVEFSK